MRSNGKGMQSQARDDCSSNCLFQIPLGCHVRTDSAYSALAYNLGWPLVSHRQIYRFSGSRYGRSSFYFRRYLD